ncbi:MAG TPA: hypothetical protein VH916_11355 [Dehalococcoidia bacterium]|jgi:hypothetical protein
MDHIDTWATVFRMEAELKHRAGARRARLGPLPQRPGFVTALWAKVAQFGRRSLRRDVPRPAASGARYDRPVCQGRTLAARRVCRVCGARFHGATAFRPGYRPRRCLRRSALGRTRI